MAIQTLRTEDMGNGLTMSETLSTWPDGSKSLSWEVYCERCDDFTMVYSRKEAEEVVVEHECPENEVLDGESTESQVRACMLGYHPL